MLFIIYIIELLLQEVGVETELCDVTRTGALGRIQSVYVRDPDKNLIELAHYTQPRKAEKIVTKHMSISDIANTKAKDN